MRKEILKNPNPVLREVSMEIIRDQIGSERLNQLVVDMKDSLKAEGGVGLAAPQIGVPERVILIHEHPNKGEPEVYINPRISGMSFSKVDSEEGCLSVPGVWGIVKRFRKIHFKAYNQEGVKVSTKITGFKAVIIQHEIDHLNGVLFIDKVEKLTKHEKL